MTDIERLAKFHEQSRDAELRTLRSALRETTNWVCESCGNVRSSGDCLGCELKALREFERRVRESLENADTYDEESRLNCLAITWLDKQRKAKR